MTSHKSSSKAKKVGKSTSKAPRPLAKKVVKALNDPNDLKVCQQVPSLSPQFNRRLILVLPTWHTVQDIFRKPDVRSILGFRV